MKRSIVVALGIYLGALAGCGGGGGSTASTSPAPATPAMPTPSTPAPMPAPSTTPGSTTPMTTPMPMGPTDTTGYPGTTTPGSTSTTPMPMPAGSGYPGSGYPGTTTTTPMPMPMPPGTGSGYTNDGTTNTTPPTTPDGYPMPAPGGYTPAPMPGTAYPGGTNPSAQAAPVKTLTELASESFSKGRDREGFQFLYAAAITSDEEAAETLPEDFGWVAYLKRPSMGIRWGIGVSYNPPRGYTGHPCPVGYEPPQQATGNQPGSDTANTGGQPRPRRSRVFGQRYQNQNQNPNPQPATNPNQQQNVPQGPPSDPSELLTYYTGEVGERIVEEIEKRMEDGKFGPVLQRVLENHSSPPPVNANNNPGGYAPQPGYNPMPTGNSAEQPKQEKFKPGGVMPSIVMLGEGSEKQLISDAEEQEVDFVILFDVTVRPSPSKTTASNTTKFRVMSLENAKLPAATADAEGAKPREIYASKVINNRTVEKAREDDKADPVDTELTALFEAIDAEITAAPLPEKLSAPGVAMKRATFLVSKEADNPLPSLAEIRCYHAKKLISDEELATLVAQMLGPEKARKLASGKTEAERAAALSKWLPKTPQGGGAGASPMPTNYLP